MNSDYYVISDLRDTLTRCSPWTLDPDSRASCKKKKVRKLEPEEEVASGTVVGHFSVQLWLQYCLKYLGVRNICLVMNEKKYTGLKLICLLTLCDFKFLFGLRAIVARFHLSVLFWSLR